VTPPLLAVGHKIEASAAAETPAPAAAQAGGDVAEVSTTDAMSASILEIIDLDAPDLLSNDRDIYKVVLECMLADPVESEVKASRSTAPVAMAPAEAAEPATKEPTSGATVAGQLTAGRAGDVAGPESSVTSEAAEEVLGDPATGAELTLVVPSPPMAGVDSTVAEALESSSLGPATPVDETTPMESPSLAAPQEHDALGSVVGATSLKIQEIGKGSGAAQPPELDEGDAQIFNLARFSWATAFEADASAGENEESAACHSLERGLLWARRAFDQLILPRTTVSPLDVVVHS
jgi:hypothetical protein